MEQSQIIPENTETANVQERRTLPLLTKYEKARIIGIRATQLSNGSMPRVNIDSDNVLEIAEAEFRAMDIPFMVRRYLPDGSYEDWRLKEMIVADDEMF